MISTTLGYWSEGLSQPQPELIPAYILYVDYYTGTTKLTQGLEYIPANATYMRPYAKIASVPQGHKEGETIQLEGADASLTLAALGYDPTLTFKLGNGPVLYTWYVDSVADGNEIGNGRNISWTLPAGDGQKGTYTRSIILQVTDIGSSARPATTDTATVTIVTKNGYLPALLKH